MAPDISAHPAGGGSRPATSQTLCPLTVLGAEGVLSAAAGNSSERPLLTSAGSTAPPASRANSSCLTTLSRSSPSRSSGKCSLGTLGSVGWLTGSAPAFRHLLQLWGCSPCMLHSARIPHTVIAKQKLLWEQCCCNTLSYSENISSLCLVSFFLCKFLFSVSAA